MSSADAAWLHMDRPTNLMVINSVLLFEAPVDWDRVRQVTQERLVGRYPRFHQRVVESHLPLWAPSWEEDPDFALEHHLHHRAPRPVAEDVFGLRSGADQIPATERREGSDRRDQADPDHDRRRAGAKRLRRHESDVLKRGQVDQSPWCCQQRADELPEEGDRDQPVGDPSTRSGPSAPAWRRSGASRPSMRWSADWTPPTPRSRPGVACPAEVASRATTAMGSVLTTPLWGLS